MDEVQEKYVLDYILNEDDKSGLKEVVHREINYLIERGFTFLEAARVVKEIVTEVRNDYGD